MAAPNELSFLPEDYLESKARRRTNALCAVLFCVVIIATGSAFWVSEKSMRAVDQRAAAVNRRYTDAAKRIEQFQQIQEKQRTMSHQAELTASLIETVPRTRILAEIIKAMPPNLSLLDFQLDAKVVKSPGTPVGKTAFDVRKAQVDATRTTDLLADAKPRVYNVQMRATGIAQTDVQVAQFISKLNESKILQDVNLIFTDEYSADKAGKKETEKLRKFQIEMSLNPSARIDPDEPPINLKTASTVLESN